MRERAATHVAVVCRYAAMMSAGCGDDTGFLFPNTQPGTLMIRNSGCHLRKKKSKDKYVNFMASSAVLGKVGPLVKKLTSPIFASHVLKHTPLP